MVKWIACYCRVSTDEQAREGISIDEQQNRLQAYCISQGWTNFKFYIDDGYSAKNTKRPQLQKLFNDIKQEKVTTVLVTKIDRFTRRLKDMLDLHKILEDHNISFCSSSESFDTSTAVGRMMLQILTMFAEFERERISERVTDNMLFNAENGKVQQPPCFGYDIIENELNPNKKEKIFIINKEEKKWAIKIFRLFVDENWGYMKIAKFLNQNNVKTKKGKEWSAQGVRVYIPNELLIGRMIWNKRNTKNDKWKIRDVSEWKITENICDPIIPLELWYKAQFKISKNQPRGTQKSPYLLTGLIKCGYCSSSMVSSRSRTSRKGEYKNTYLCSKYRQGQGCIYNWIEMDVIDPLIIETVVEFLEENKQLEIDDKNISVNIDALKKELQELNEAIDLQLQLLEAKEISLDEFKRARLRINKNKEKIEIQLKSLGQSGDKKLLSVSKDILPVLLDDKYSKEEKREKLKEIIHNIIIYDKGKIAPDIIFKDI
jgi:site-specific DNA recombinase